MKFIRVDDFPYGDPSFFRRKENCIERFIAAISLLESEDVDYVIGVTPFLIESSHFDILNGILKRGKAVMHGFTHAWDFEPWSNITSCWRKGGEFSRYSESETAKRDYGNALEVMSKLKRFDEKIHIPPFNCYNQHFIDAFEHHGGQLILGCDKEHINYDHGNHKHLSSRVSLSRWQISYGDASQVNSMIREIDLKKEHITLHWCFDTEQHSQWKSDYRNLVSNFKMLCKND